ncbi:BREX-1 system phosphatase PglZ type B [Pseudarthrobacter sp. CC4]|uniref:BREX-1 system phosphatase PglZ type B n=1 Tax=Pseudarthrobacter sp. CC4 TaxID=3029190 RepID=UPI003B8B91D7
MSDIILERVVACLRAARDAYDPNIRVPPVALLWPDEGGQWQPVLDQLSQHLPIVSLGSYDPDLRQGPAYWLRCVVAGSIDIGLSDGPPIIYLPHVSRSALRAADTCPPALAPIAEMQYRSQWFSHPSSRDWTVRGLLSHRDRGLGLQIAPDSETSAALLLALDRLLDEPIGRFESQVLDADSLLELVNDDAVHSLLRWLDNPDGYRIQTNTAQWLAFVQQCKAVYGFDPTLDGEITAARSLGHRNGPWGNVWRRFAESPERYPGIVDRLRKARPEEFLVESKEAWPQDNENAEDQLRRSLRDFEALTPAGARDEASRLDARHRWRRNTVWADLEQAPLAFAVEQLLLLSELTRQPLASADLQSLVADYTSRGWKVDDAVVRTLAISKTTRDREAVAAASGAMYRQWIEAGAKALQKLIAPGTNAYTSYDPGQSAHTTEGSVTVFVDGLRLDVAHRLQKRLAGAGLSVGVGTTLAALPTVTQTAKPAISPVLPGSLSAGPELHAADTNTRTRASIRVLRNLMASNGIQVLETLDIGNPVGKAWTEAGEIDHRGHDLGVRLVDYLDEEVERIALRVRELLDAGWTKVEIVTDHGWLLLPGGMVKVELPVATTEIKKGRCARLKPGAVVDVPTVPWFWDKDVRIALAPGVTCFEANKEYEHGGVSPQECIVPRLTVQAGVGTTLVRGPEFKTVKWLGLQCRVEFTGVTEKVVIDLRGLPSEPKSSIAEQAKETSSPGRISLIVPDEEHEGERAHLMLLTLGGQILAQREVVVGRNR